MNDHLSSKISGFCVANLRNSLLLRAIRRLKSEYFEHNLLHPELIRGSLMDKSFLEFFQTGKFIAARKWDDLDRLWESVKNNNSEGWYVYAVGEEPPTQTASSDKLDEFISKIDVLLRKEHDEDYCGIVYADDHENPTLVKIFDPNNLGVVCGYSDNPPLPGWMLSTLPPVNLPEAFSPPGNRKRWWQKIFAVK